MKLSKLIPEIKIVPNDPLFGKWFKHRGTGKAFSIIGKRKIWDRSFNEEPIEVEGYVIGFNNIEGTVEYSVETVHDLIKKKIWVQVNKPEDINEIKIVPNSRPKLFNDWLKDEFHPQLIKRISSDLSNIGIYDILDSVFHSAKTDRLQELLKSIIKNDDIESEIDVDRASDKDIIEFVDQNEELHNKIIKAFTQFYWTTIDYKALNELFIKEVEHQIDSNNDFEDDAGGYIKWAGKVAIDIGYDTELILEPLDAAWYKSSELENVLYKYLQKSYEFLAEIKIVPNQRIDTNEKLLYFVNRNKEEIARKLLEQEVGVDWELYYDDLMENNPIIFRNNETKIAWWQGTVKWDNIYLNVDKDNYETNPIEVRGVTIYVR